MDEDRNNEPARRFKNILSSDKDDEYTLPEPPLPAPSPSQPQSQSLLDKLPRMKPAEQAPPVKTKADAVEPETPASTESISDLPPSEPLVQAGKPPEQQAEQPVETQTVVLQETQEMSRREKLLRALWTTTSIISMIVNIVVIIVLVIALWAYRDIKLPESVDVTMVNKLLSGLYSNFEKMDRATIETVIPVDAQIPLDIIVPVQTTTQITLAETVNIPNAQVVINTGGLNINSTARVTLPAGTPLMVNLNFDLPVQDTIPVHLDVPVKIPMADTELHEPFVGLQDVVRPLYCLVDPNATGLDAQLICR